MYGRSRKSLFRRTGPIICTTSGIGASECIALAEAPLAPAGEVVRLEANRMAENEIRPKARMICNAEARTELSCFFFIFFFRWSSRKQAAFFHGTPQAPQEILLMFCWVSSDGVLRSGVPLSTNKRARESRLFCLKPRAARHYVRCDCLYSAASR